MRFSVKEAAENLVKSIVERGLNPEEVLNPHTFNLKDLPPDEIHSEAMRRMAAKLAEDSEHDYICHICGTHHHGFKDEDGTKYTSEGLLFACIQDHIIDFYAQLPPEVHPELIEKRVANLHPKHRKMTREHLMRYSKKEKGWWEEDEDSGD